MYIHIYIYIYIYICVTWVPHSGNMLHQNSQQSGMSLENATDKSLDVSSQNTLTKSDNPLEDTTDK